MGAYAVCADTAGRFCAGQGGSYILIRASSKEALYWAVTGDRLDFGLSLVRLCIGLALVIGFALGWYWQYALHWADIGNRLCIGLALAIGFALGWHW